MTQGSTAGALEARAPNGETERGTSGAGTEVEVRPTSPEAQEARLAALEARLADLERRAVSHKATLVVFSGDMDKVMASLVIATGAAAMGLEVTVFHTFWGLAALRKNRSFEGKNLVEKALSLAIPAGLEGLSPSKMAFAGAGAKLFRSRMKEKGVQTPEEMFALARELGVRFLACEMSMDVMGIRKDELLDGIEVAGVAAYLGEAAESKVTLFV